MTHAVSHAKPRQAAPAERFPETPPSWYLVGRSRDVGNRPVERQLFGKRLVAFRPDESQVAVLDGDCSHMGADLTRGRLVNGRLQCPFHGWEYDGKGQCVSIPAAADVPQFARQTAYPVEERHGLLFAFSRPELRFSLPPFLEIEGTSLVPSRPMQYEIECPWWMFGANGFDLQHFSLVHGRRLVGEPVVDSPDPFSRRIRFRSEVVGGAASDRLVRTLAGRFVDVSITVWAGNLIAVSAEFRRTTSRMIFAIAPLTSGWTRVDLVVFVERGPMWRRWLKPLSLWLRRSMTMAFVSDDVRRVRRAAYRPAALIDADRVMFDYYNWLAGLFHNERERT